jgi:2-keto-3-deoxy-L-rhamnonate aldolase RhmA
MATRVLDGGAMGIVIPHVDTPEEAREIADKLRYPPRGHRSVGGATRSSTTRRRRSAR